MPRQQEESRRTLLERIAEATVDFGGQAIKTIRGEFVAAERCHGRREADGCLAAASAGLNTRIELF